MKLIRITDVIDHQRIEDTDIIFEAYYSKKCGIYIFNDNGRFQINKFINHKPHKPNDWADNNNTYQDRIMISVKVWR